VFVVSVVLLVLVEVSILSLFFSLQRVEEDEEFL
jgi:hypothetical protein